LRRGARLTLSIGFVCPAGVIIFGVAGLGDVVDWARQQVASRVPKADLDQRDPDYIRDQLPGLWLLASVYFRADVTGLGRIPREGTCCPASRSTAASARRVSSGYISALAAIG
jgi:hypothetical protein